MDFFDFEREQHFRAIWGAVQIERPVEYSLFTFGESTLPYYLVCHPTESSDLVSMSKGEIKIARPTIITPENMQPEFQNFFENDEGAGVVDFLLARTAAFSNLKLSNRSGPGKIVSDSVEEVLSKLNRELDAEEEDRVAILSAPKELAGVAVLKYATERVISSAPGNVQELRERGFLS